MTKPCLMERLYHPLYGTIKVDGKTHGPQHFFESREMTGDMLARMSSNIDLGNMLKHRHFKLTGISIIPSYQAYPTDVERFIDEGHLRFILGQKEYLYVPLDLVTYYNHLQGPQQMEPLSVSKLKISEPVYELPQDSRMEIAPLQTFSMRIDYKTAPKITSPFLVHAYLFGYQLRQVY